MKTEYYIKKDPNILDKCANGDCPLRPECYRAQKKSEPKQFFERFEPGKDGKCSSFIRI